jgi:hypothetical protein
LAKAEDDRRKEAQRLAEEKALMHAKGKAVE